MMCALVGGTDVGVGVSGDADLVGDADVVGDGDVVDGKEEREVPAIGGSMTECVRFKAKRQGRPT